MLTQAPGIFTSLYTTLAAWSQLSVAVMTGAEGTLLQEVLRSVGRPCIIGAIWSLTSIFCTTTLLFPQTSVAVHFRVRV